MAIFGKRLLAARAVTEPPELVDWRLDPLVDFEPYDLDTATVGRLLELLRLLGLTTGQVDMRVATDGVPVFLEVNPSGQFLFLEADAGLPVSGAMAELLAGALRPASTRQPAVSG